MTINKISRSGSSVVTLAELQSGSAIFVQKVSRVSTAGPVITGGLVSQADIIKRGFQVQTVVGRAIVNPYGSVFNFFDRLGLSDEAILLLARQVALADQFFITHNTPKFLLNKGLSDSEPILERISLRIAAFRVFEDAQFVSTATKFTLIRPLADSQSLIDTTRISAGYQRAAADIQNIVDTRLTLTIGKTNRDTVTQSDSIANDITALKQDQATATEAKALLPGKALFDGVRIRNRDDPGPALFVTKLLRDATTILDLTGVFDGLTYQNIMYRFDEFSVSDNFSRTFAADRRFIDDQSVIEKIFLQRGFVYQDAATPVDSKQLSVTVQRSDVTVVAEALQRAFLAQRVFQDAAIMSEVKTLTAGLGKADVAEMLERITSRAIGKGLTDTTTVSENIGKSPIKKLVDSIISSEAIAKLINKGIVDNTTITEDILILLINFFRVNADSVDALNAQPIFSAGKRLIDTTVNLEQNFKLIGKAAEDILSTINDRPLFAVSKYLADIASMSDLAAAFDGITYNYGLNRLDAVSIIDDSIINRVFLAFRQFQDFQTIDDVFAKARGIGFDARSDTFALLDSILIGKLPEDTLLIGSGQDQRSRAEERISFNFTLPITTNYRTQIDDVNFFTGAQENLIGIVSGQTFVGSFMFASTSAGASVQVTSTGTGLGVNGGFATVYANPYISFNGAGNRTVATVPIDFTAITSVSINFAYIAGNMINGGEQPDLNEDLIIEYSIDDGSNFVTADTIAAISTYGSVGWSQYTSSLPTAAKTSSTILRWRQTKQSISTGDNWGITNIQLGGTSFGTFIRTYYDDNTASIAERIGLGRFQRAADTVDVTSSKDRSTLQFTLAAKQSINRSFSGTTVTARDTDQLFIGRQDITGILITSIGTFIETTSITIAGNIIRRSEQFDNALWTKTIVSVSADQTTAPDDTLTADKITQNSSTIDGYIQQNDVTTLRSTVTYRHSVYLKGDGTSVGRIVAIGNYAAGARLGVTSVTLTADWQRVSASFVASGSSGRDIFIQTRGFAGGVHTANMLQNQSVFAWGYQITTGSTLQAYNEYSRTTSATIASGTVNVDIYTTSNTFITGVGVRLSSEPLENVKFNVGKGILLDPANMSDFFKAVVSTVIAPARANSAEVLLVADDFAKLFTIDRRLTDEPGITDDIRLIIAPTRSFFEALLIGSGQDQRSSNEELISFAITKPVIDEQTIADQPLLVYGLATVRETQNVGLPEFTGIRVSGDDRERISLAISIPAKQAVDLTFSGITTTAATSGERLFIGQQYTGAYRAGESLERIQLQANKNIYTDNRTNLLRWSEDTQGTSEFNGAQRTDNVYIAPDGTQTGSQITNILTGSRLYTTVRVTPGVEYTWSFYVYGTADTSRTVAANLQVYNADNASEILVATTSYLSQIALSSWTRITVPLGILPGTVGNLRLEYLVGVAAKIGLWGSQLNEGSSATNYVKTTASPLATPTDSVRIGNPSTLRFGRDIYGSGYSQGESVQFAITNIKRETQSIADDFIKVLAINRIVSDTVSITEVFIKELLRPPFTETIVVGSGQDRRQALTERTFFTITKLFRAVQAPIQNVLGEGGNIVPWSEDFTSAPWASTQITVVADQETAPDTTMTADKFIVNSGFAYVEQPDVALRQGETYTHSVYLKGDGSSIGQLCAIGNFDNGNRVGQTSIVLTSSWQRLSATFTTLSAGPNRNLFIQPAGIAGSNLAVGQAVFVWGYQITTGSTLQAYVRTTSTGIQGPILSSSGGGFDDHYVAVTDVDKPYFISTKPVRETQNVGLPGFTGIRTSGDDRERAILDVSMPMTRGVAGSVTVKTINAAGNNVQSSVALNFGARSPDIVGTVDLFFIAILRDVVAADFFTIGTDQGFRQTQGLETTKFTINKRARQDVQSSSLVTYGSAQFNKAYPDGPYLSTTVTAPGTDSLTYEWFFYQTTSTGTQGMLQTRSDTTSSDGIEVAIIDSSISITTFGETLLTSVGTVALNTWYHLALVRNGTTSFTTYLGGSSIGSFSKAGLTGTQLSLGRRSATGADEFFGGNLTNFRYNKGVAVYTSNFAVPTSTLTTVGGGIGGGSAKITASLQNRLTVNSSAVFTLGTNNHTIEFWMYQTSRGLYDTAWIYGDGTSSASVNAYYFNAGTSQFQLILGNGGSFQVSTNLTGGAAPSLNAWHHYAIVRNGTIITLYIDGINRGTISAGSQNITAQNGSMCLGGAGTPDVTITGFVTNLRVVNGTAVYTSNFTPSSFVLPAITNTQLLLLFTNSGELLKDSSVNNFTVNNINAVTFDSSTTLLNVNNTELLLTFTDTDGSGFLTDSSPNNRIIVNNNGVVSSTLNAFGYTTSVVVDTSTYSDTDLVQIGFGTRQTPGIKFSGSNLERIPFTVGITAYRGTSGTIILNTIDSSPDVNYQQSSVAVSRGSRSGDEVGTLDWFAVAKGISRIFQDSFTMGSGEDRRQALTERTFFTIGKRFGEDVIPDDFLLTFDGLTYRATMLERETQNVGLPGFTGIRTSGNDRERLSLDVSMPMTRGVAGSVTVKTIDAPGNNAQSSVALNFGARSPDIVGTIDRISIVQLKPIAVTDFFTIGTDDGFRRTSGLETVKFLIGLRETDIQSIGFGSSNSSGIRRSGSDLERTAFNITRRATQANYTPYYTSLSTYYRSSPTIDRGNFLTNSEFATGVSGWSASQANVSANVIISPIGTVNGSKLRETGTAKNTHYVRQVTGSTYDSGATVTFSIWAKAAERAGVELAISNGVNSIVNASFNLSSGAVIATGHWEEFPYNGDWTSITATMQAAGNGWYRCSITTMKTNIASGGSPNSIQPHVLIHNQTTSNYAGTVGSGIYIWGAQLETAGNLGPYMPTQGASIRLLQNLANDGDFVLIGTGTGLLSRPRRTSGNEFEKLSIDFFKDRTGILDSAFFTSDTVRLSLGLGLSENSEILESISVSPLIFRSLIESISLTETIEPLKIKVRNLTDVSGDLDPFRNINTMVSLGTLRMTSYVDIDYLESDYVGESRSFT